MMRWASLLLMSFMSLFAFMANAQDFDSDSYKAFIEETMSASNVPGLAVIILENDRTLYENTFGISDDENSPVTLDTPFQLGSVSKTFAALVMVQLAAENQVDLDAPVITYLPNFRLRNTDS